MLRVGKGGKNRRRGKNDDAFKRELIFKEFGQEYGQVTKTLGGGNMDVQCFDGERRICHIRGKMRKKVISNGSSFSDTSFAPRYGLIQVILS